MVIKSDGLLLKQDLTSMNNNISLIPSFNPPSLKDASKQTHDQRLSSLLLSNNSKKKTYQPQNYKTLQPIKNLISENIEENQGDEIILFDGKVKHQPLTQSNEITNYTDLSSNSNNRKTYNKVGNEIEVPIINISTAINGNNATKLAVDSNRSNQALQLSSLLSQPIIKKHDLAKGNQLTSKDALVNKKSTANHEPESLVSSDENLRKKICFDHHQLHHYQQHHYKQEDFIGIDNICRNVGNSMKALQITLDKIKVSKSVICSVLWKGLKTNHIPTTIKYCTNKMKCINWNCTCDHQIRRDYISNNLLCVVFYLPDEANITYFLPLGKKHYYYL